MNATQAGGLILPLAWATGSLPDGAEPPPTDSIIEVRSQTLEAQAVSDLGSVWLAQTNGRCL